MALILSGNGSATVTESTATVSGSTISGLEVGVIYAISFGKHTAGASTDITLSGATILYQNRNHSGGDADANFGIAFFVANATTVTQTSAMILGSKVYKIA